MLLILLVLLFLAWPRLSVAVGRRLSSLTKTQEQGLAVPEPVRKEVAATSPTSSEEASVSSSAATQTASRQSLANAVDPAGHLLRVNGTLSPETLPQINQKSPLGPALASSALDHLSSPQPVPLLLPAEQLETFRREDLAAAGAERASVLLVNQEHPLPDDYQPPLTADPYYGLLMHEELIVPFFTMDGDLFNSYGEHLGITSLYRSREEQGVLYEKDQQYTQLPGASEHETGLAVDYFINATCSGDSVTQHPAGSYLNRNCWRFGFLLRYPEGKESVTGIPCEPWHLRYVGLPHSAIMQAAQWTLEEYISFLQPDTLYQWGEADGGYVLLRSAAPQVKLPRATEAIAFSPDNTGYTLYWGVYRP